ncbi:MAG: T9SS type A sorting domain-containing protein [Bacteroidota bacterium]|nr:T9SS type A sorting domain-containing protein [Bacteroidota bacterium]
MNKISFFISLFFILSHFISAQLKIYNLTNDPYRNISNHNFSSSKNTRAEASNNQVSPSVYINVNKGNLVRCATDTSAVEFKATGLNTGTSPTYNWFVNDLLVGSGSTFRYASPQNNDVVYCSMLSNSNCVASPKIAISNKFTISTNTTLSSSVNISVVSGSDPDCNGLSPVTLQAIPTNGGSNPQYSWYIGGTPTGTNSNILSLPTLLGTNFVRVRLKSSLTCINNGIDTSNGYYTRKIFRLISPVVNLELVSKTNNNCGVPIYSFKASSDNAGEKPIYNWYLNNVLYATTSVPGGNFSVELPNSNDEFYVVLTPSLTCVNPKNAISNSFVRKDTLNLPFFEDFANSDVFTNNQIWVKNGGTFINNNYCVQPYTPKVATFDGLQQNGTPYDTVNITSRGITDVLTSLPIDLSSAKYSDSVGIHFLFQPAGIGEIPDKKQGDNLTLYFLDSGENWIEVWSAAKETLLNAFVLSANPSFYKKVVNIPSISGTTFFHRGFQFKFEAFGRLSGSYDIWNVDYIYLNKNVTPSIFFLDQSFGIQPGKLFKNYSAIPTKHINYALPRVAFDTLRSNINNLDNNFNNLSIGAIVSDKYANVFNKSLVAAPSGNFRVNANVKNIPISAQLTGIFNSSVSSPLELFYSFFVSGGGDVDNSDGKGIPYTKNNTITGATYLDNFYAYDDGSAEYGIGLNYKFGQIAYKFKSLRPDTIYNIAINFAKLGQILQNQSIVLTIWRDTLPNSSTDYTSGNVVYRKSVLLNYPSGRDRWTVYPVDPPVPITSTFYIGYQQVTDQLIAVGFDKNFDSSDKMFYSNSGNSNSWQPYKDSLNTGSMLMRPVFGTFRYINSISNEITDSPPMTIYPNPATNVINFSESIQGITLFDLMGNVHLQIENTLNIIDISNLNRGIYIAKILHKDKYIFRKVIIE